MYLLQLFQIFHILYFFYKFHIFNLFHAFHLSHLSQCVLLLKKSQESQTVSVLLPKKSWNSQMVGIPLPKKSWKSQIVSVPLLKKPHKSQTVGVPLPKKSWKSQTVFCCQLYYQYFDFHYKWPKLLFYVNVNYQDQNQYQHIAYCLLHYLHQRIYFIFFFLFRSQLSPGSTVFTSSNFRIVTEYITLIALLT